jgi:hypothetical protein
MAVSMAADRGKGMNTVWLGEQHGDLLALERELQSGCCRPAECIEDSSALRKQRKPDFRAAEQCNTSSRRNGQ